MLIPHSVHEQIANPGRLQELFMTYVEDAQLRFDNSKTLATNTLYDSKPTTVSPQLNFFGDSTFTPANTNITGNSFTRPQSEHFVIFGIRGSHGFDANPVLSQWIRGLTATGPGVGNAVYDLTVNSVRQLRAIPTTEHYDDLVTKDVGLMYLSVPIVWPGESELELNMRNLPGNALNDTALSLRFDLVGIGLV